MRHYILPINLTDYLSRYVKDAAYLERIANYIKEATASSGEKLIFLKKKKFGLDAIYTLDVNIDGYHRAVFRAVDFEGKSCLMLWSFVWAHNYRAALASTTFIKAPTREVLHDFYDSEIELYGESPDDASMVPEAMIFLREDWYQPTTLQSEILQAHQFPQLLIGPPGSGKTLIAMGLLQEQALKHYQEQKQDVLKLLYITGNASLVRSMKKSWSDWEKEYLPSNYNKVMVTFITVQEYLDWYAESVGKILITEKDFCAELMKIMPEEKTVNVLQELYHNAWMLEMDLLAEHKSYAQSHYMGTVGNRHSVYSPEEREKKYPAFIEILRTLNEKNYFFPGISSITDIDEDALYDLAIMDESQKETLQSLLGILRFTKEKKMLFIGDSFQKGTLFFSPLERLKMSIEFLFRQELYMHQLTNSLRLKPDVARLAHELVLLYSNLKGGKVDTTSYTSIDARHCYEDDVIRSVYLLQKDTEQFAQLGSDATTAAIVLSSEDVEDARQLIQGNNVFTHDEAQGLEFSRVFLYLSPKTLSQFNAVTKLMKEKNITAESILGERPHLVRDKTQTDGVAHELLSHLFVALSRTSGELLVYLDAEKPLANQLNSFLAWFTKKLGHEADTRIKNVESTQQDWLDTIHRFIEEGAFSQAQANLQKIFQLSGPEAKMYLDACKQQGRKSVPDLNEWVKQLRQRVVLKPTAPKKSLLAPSLVADIEACYADSGKTEHLKSMLSHEKAANIWFTYPLKEGRCFWVNLFFEDRLASVLGCFKDEKNKKQKEKYGRLIKQGLDIAQERQDVLLLFCLRVYNTELITYFPEIRNSFIEKGKWFNYQKMLPVFQTVTMEQRKRLLQFISLTKDKSALTAQYTDEQGNVGPSILHYLLTLDYGEPGEVCRLHHNVIIKNLGLRITQPGAYQNYTIFACLMKSKAGFNYLKTHFDGVLKNLSASEQIHFIFEQVTDEQGNKADCLFHALCGDPKGLKLVRAYWDGLKPFFQKNPHFIFDEFIEDVNFFYYLCSTEEGCSVLEKDWSFFKALIEQRPYNLFDAAIKGSSDKGINYFYLLCTHLEGRKLIDNHWDFFKPLIEKNQDMLFVRLTDEPDEQGMSPFYWLCTEDEGFLFIKKYWTYFKPIIEQNHDKLFEPATGDSLDNGTTPFYHLCFNAGVELIANNWDVFKPVIEQNHHKLFEPVIGDGLDQGKSIIYMICLNRNGARLIANNWDVFKPVMEQNHHKLFEPVTGDGFEQGMSPFYFLCERIDAVNIIGDHWDTFKTIIKRNQHRFFTLVIGEGEDQGTSPFYHFYMSSEGKKIIKKDPEFFHKLIEDNAQHFFKQINVQGKAKRISCFSFLFEIATGYKIIQEHQPVFGKIIKDNPQHLFDEMPERKGDNKSRNVLYMLCFHKTFEPMITELWPYIKKFISLQDLKKYPNGMLLVQKIQSSIASPSSAYGLFHDPSKDVADVGGAVSMRPK